jgi:hypothetical protein
MNDLQYTSIQLEFINSPITHSQFIEGPAGAGKTTAGILHIQKLFKLGAAPETILVFVPQRTLAFPYYQFSQETDTFSASTMQILTLDGMAQRLIHLFWPVISEKAGFGEPYRLPTFLTLETAQYHLAHLVRPLLLYEGFFESITLDKNRLYSQILDNINKAALVGFPHTEIGERLKRAWIGDPGQLSVYEDVQTCVNMFRQFCYQNNYLDYSLQIECFNRYLLPEPFVQQYLQRSFRHLIADNVEEDTPVAHDFITQWLELFDTSLLIYDWDAGYRSFLGSDPLSGYRLKNSCEDHWVFGSNLVSSPRLLDIGKKVFEMLIPEQNFLWQLPRAEQFRVEFQKDQAEYLKVAEIGEKAEPVIEFEIQRYFTEMLDWVAGRISNLILEHKVPPDEIVVLAPYLPDALRFSLQNRLTVLGIAVRSHRPSRSLRDEPATRCLLTLCALANPEWGFTPERSDVVNTFMQAIDGLDQVRAQLLANIVYRMQEGKPVLSSFEIIQPEIQARITYVFGERYELLRKWLVASREIQQELDHFISRMFGEILSQPGFGFHSNIDAGVITANLIESIQKFRLGLKDKLLEEGRSSGQEYYQTVHDGLVAAQYLSRWIDQAEEGVLIAPAFSFLLANQPVDFQFWLDISSRGWHERLDQPLTNPFVLSRYWEIGRPWSDVDEIQAGDSQLARLVLGLVRRCKKKVILGISEIDDQGYEERGLLLRIIQTLLLQGKEDGVNHIGEVR